MFEPTGVFRLDVASAPSARRALPLLLLAATLSLVARAAGAFENADCFGCHGNEKVMSAFLGAKGKALVVDKQKFAVSTHGKDLCVSCHSDVTELPHPAQFAAKPVSCAQCHRVETEIYLKSDHGQALQKGVHEAASCKDCHGESHYMLGYRNAQSSVYRLNLPGTCDRCHGNAAEMAQFHLRKAAPVRSYKESVHGIALLQKHELNAAVCTDCHGSHNLHRSTNRESKLYWQNVPGTCGKCHENVDQTYLRSIHGSAAMGGVRDAPVCTDCHGEHVISAAKGAGSRVAPAQVPETCAQCHAAQRIIAKYGLPPNVFTTYMESFHGLALQGGNLTAANCSSCHGAHDILPEDDARSSINPRNLPHTCGKCHPGIGTRLGREFFRIHAAASARPWLVKVITWFYLVMIALTIGGMATFNLLDYLRKTRAHVRAVRSATDAELRMTRLMRAQHFALFALFLLLVYTGFAHRFPDAFWSWPFRSLANGAAVRGIAHRVCGCVFTAFLAAHLLIMLGTRRGRAGLRDLWPVPGDLKDALAQLAYNLGLRRMPPPHRRWNYAEKSEYWALLWGSGVMIVTGLMLMFTATVLANLPQVWYEAAQVIHFYEAVLATLAILVWHFYWVIFDPRMYPMDPSWLIGKSVKHGLEESKPGAEAPRPGKD